MRPAIPIVPGMDLPVTEYAKGQDQYITLPAWQSGDESGTVLSRWHLSWWERLKILCSGDLYVWLATFGMPLQPIAFAVGKPKVVKLGAGILVVSEESPKSSEESSKSSEACE